MKRDRKYVIIDSKEKLYSCIDIKGEDECWNWNRSTNIWGYGECRYEGKTTNASRAAYKLLVGPIKEGNVVCHACDNPACCNPNHL